MAPPITRSQSSISDERMRQMMSRDPEALLRPARDRTPVEAPPPLVARRGKAITDLPAELHAKIAAHLTPRGRVDLSMSSRELKARYAPHVARAWLLHRVTAAAQGVAPPLFDRSTGATDADIERELAALMAPAKDDSVRITLGELPMAERVQALLELLCRRPAPNEAALQRLARTLAVPHLDGLNEDDRDRVIVAVANLRTADDSVWSLAQMERQPRPAHAPIVAELAYHLANDFTDPRTRQITDRQGCMQAMERMATLATRLEAHTEGLAAGIHIELATTFQKLPDPLAAAHRLIADVEARPEPHRAFIYTLLATGRQLRIGLPPQPALTDEQRDGLVDALRTAALPLPRELLRQWHERLSSLPFRAGPSIF